MSYMPEELQDAENTLDQISQYSLRSVFVVTRGKTLDEALANTSQFLNRADQLKDQGLVKKYSRRHFSCYSRGYSASPYQTDGMNTGQRKRKHCLKKGSLLAAKQERL